MKILPLLLVALVALVWWLRRRSRRVRHAHAPVAREEIARTATHVTTTLTPAQVLDAVVEDAVTHAPSGRPPRRYAAGRRDHRSVELTLRLLERPELAPVCTVLVEADPVDRTDGAAAGEAGHDTAHDTGHVPGLDAAAGTPTTGTPSAGTTTGTTRVRLEVLDILVVDRLVDRLAQVIATRDLVLDAIAHRDPHATFRDELLDLPD